MKIFENPALNAEQPQQDMDSASVINNSTDLNGQASAAASAGQPTPLIDTPMSGGIAEKEEAIKILKMAQFLDDEGRFISKSSIVCPGLRRKAQVLFSVMLKADMNPCFLAQNRPIHVSNVKRLVNDLRKNGETTFDEPAKIIPATKALKEGLKLVTLDGKELTLETPGIEKYFVVTDGQHRTIACEQYLDLDLWVEVAEYNCDTMTYVGHTNNTRDSWDRDDISYSVITKCADKVNVLEEIRIFKQTFGVSDKCAEFAINRTKDLFRRSELNDIQLGKKEPDSKYICDKSLKQVGWDIMWSIRSATQVLDSKEQKMFKKIEFLEAIIYIKKALTDTNKIEEAQQFELNIAPFIAQLDKSLLLDCVDDLKKKNMEALKTRVCQAYSVFIDNHANDIEKLRRQNKKAIDAMKAEQIMSSVPTKVKVGTPSEVMEALTATAMKKVAIQKPAKATVDKKHDTIADQQPESETIESNFNNPFNNE